MVSTSDLSYPSKFPELELISDDRFGTRWKFLPSIRLETVALLILEQPRALQLGFFDADYPSPSDPGAYFSVAHWKGERAIYCGNHGWSSEWQEFETGVVTRFLWACRASNMGNEGALHLSTFGREIRPQSKNAATFMASHVAERLAALGA